MKRNPEKNRLFSLQKSKKDLKNIIVMKNETRLETRQELSQLEELEQLALPLQRRSNNARMAVLASSRFSRRR